MVPTKSEWEKIMTYFLEFETSSNLKKIIKELSNKSDSEYYFNKENTHLNEHERLAEQAFNLLDNKTTISNQIVIIKTKHGEHHVDLGLIPDNDFIDSIKLADMYISQNLPSQVEAYYRKIGIKKAIDFMKKGKIELSNGDHLIFDHQNKCWINPNLNINFEKNKFAIENLNEKFKDFLRTTLENDNQKLISY